MKEDSTTDIGNVIRIDDEGVRGHLDKVVRDTVEETLNAMLDAEADQLCNTLGMSARRDDAIAARGSMSESSPPLSNRIGNIVFNTKSRSMKARI